jgi:hypothetical protein
VGGDKHTKLMRREGGREGGEREGGDRETSAGGVTVIDVWNIMPCGFHVEYCTTVDPPYNMERDQMKEGEGGEREHKCSIMHT